MTNHLTLPVGWVEAELGDVLPIHYGKGLTANRRESLGSVPVYGSSGIVGKHSASLIDGPALIIGRKGSVGKVHYSAEPSWPIDTTFYAQSLADTNLRYFQYLLISRSLGRLDRSTAIPGLSRDDYNPIRVPLAPLPEQDRIVDEIEKQLTRLDAAVAALERARANLKRYRAAVLKAACEGRLVPTEAELARAEGRDYETGEQLLGRILTERRARWEADQLAKMRAKGQAPKNDNWKAKYKEPVGPDPTAAVFVPNGWALASLDQLTSRITSGSRDWSKYYDSGTSVFIMAQNVRMGSLDLSFQQLVDPPAGSPDRERSEARQDDLLVTIVGANTGDACRVPRELKEHFVCQSVALLRPVSVGLAPFLESYLTAHEGGQREFRRYMYGAGRPHLSFDQLKQTAVPLPPENDQVRVTSAVDLANSFIDRFEAVISTNLRRAQRLRQSILKRAFEGKLVPQDPNDEPASALLERIRAEGERNGAGARARRPRAASR